MMSAVVMMPGRVLHSNWLDNRRGSVKQLDCDRYCVVFVFVALGVIEFSAYLGPGGVWVASTNMTKSTHTFIYLFVLRLSVVVAAGGREGVSGWPPA